MKREGRFVTVMVHRDGDLDSWSLRVPLWLFRTATWTGAVALVLLLLGVILYAPIVRNAGRVPLLNREIARLRAENQRVQQLSQTLERVEANYDQLRTMLGAEVVPPRQQAGGVPPVAHAILARAPGAAPSAAAPLLSMPRRWPLDDPGIITRGTVGASGGGEMHSGLDIAVPIRTPIRAAGGGVVVRAGEDPEYGLFVRLRHPDGYETMYGHASRLLVTTGDTVPAGTVIALSGSTGRSTAPHLHFELLRDGRSVDPRTLANQE